MPHNIKPAGVHSLLIVALCAAGTTLAQESAIDEAIGVQSATSDGSQQSQVVIDSLDDRIASDIAENRYARQQLGRLLVYNNNLEALVADQDREIAALERQIVDFGNVERDVVPFMIEMIAALGRFIELDMPFLQRERSDRLARLEANMGRSELTVSEKYRQIMEAYQVEASYGRNIEAYIGTLSIDGVERQVDLLRVGRLLLAYQTVDQAAVGYWDRTNGAWASLDGSYRSEIADGLRIARKQMAPRLLELPVPAAGPLK